MRPLISILTPCYNNASTLPSALASIIAQSLQDWECIVIDDGSTDCPGEVVDRAGDPRIRIHRFDRNRGRGAARQKGLELAQGKYLAMVDADDWIYPGKLAAQYALLEKNPELAIISSPLAVVNSTGITGVRGGIDIREEYKAFAPSKRKVLPTIVHAPSMMRMEIVKKFGYTTCFHAAEDADLLARIVHRHPFGVMRTITYAYSEYSSANLTKMIESYSAAIRMCWRYREYCLPSALKECASYFLKMPLITGAFLAGMGDLAVAQRSRKPAASEVEEFKRAHEIITGHLRVCEKN